MSKVPIPEKKLTDRQKLSLLNLASKYRNVNVENGEPAPKTIEELFIDRDHFRRIIEREYEGFSEEFILAEINRLIKERIKNRHRIKIKNLSGIETDVDKYDLIVGTQYKFYYEPPIDASTGIIDKQVPNFTGMPYIIGTLKKYKTILGQKSSIIISFFDDQRNEFIDVDIVLSDIVRVTIPSLKIRQLPPDISGYVQEYLDHPRPSGGKSKKYKSKSKKSKSKKSKSKMYKS